MALCANGDCFGYSSIKDHCGLCPVCWVNLDDEERAALQGKPNDKVRVVTYRIPAYPGVFKRAFAWVLGGPVTTIGLILLLKKFGVL